MSFDLSEDQAASLNWAKAFAKEFLEPLAVAHSKEKIQTRTLKRLSDEGFTKLVVPVELGGLGLDSVSFILVISEIARVCGSVAVTLAVTNMIADILIREASPPQKEKFLSKLISGESLTASFCLTENSAGSDAGSLKTLAKKDSNGDYILTGEKIYVTNGAFSNLFVVMARTDPTDTSSKSISAFIVERSMTGVHFGKEEDKMGLTGSSTLRMSFEGVKVPQENRLGAEGEGFKVALRALDGGRLSVAAQALGIAKAALEAGTHYARQREAFGHPISSFQGIQWKIADAATCLAAAEALVLRAAWLKGQRRNFTLEASMAKVFTTENAFRVCEDMLQIHGGYGYTKDYPIERYVRDVRVTSLYEGTSEIQRLVISKHLLRN